MSQDQTTMRAALVRMMADLREHGWPSDATWRQAQEALGDPPMPLLPAGRAVDPLEIIRGAGK